MAIPNNHRLMIMDRTVHIVGHNLEKPSVYFNPIAQPISNRPANTRITQALALLYLARVRVVRPPASLRLANQIYRGCPPAR